MEKNFKLGVIGAGFMATAIINGIISSKKLEPSQILCSATRESSLEKISEKGIATTTDNLYLVNNSEYVLFAVKPQSLQSVFDVVKGSDITNIISIVAGTKKEKFKTQLGDIKVARCMPNTPCSVNSGAIGVDLSDFSETYDIEFIKGILSPLGTVVEVEENQLNLVTGISGSSPAYFYLFVKALIDSAKKRGLSESNARKLVVSTMIGSGKMLEKNNDKCIEELINAVCSKGGTTIEAMKVFESEGLVNIVDNAVDACIKRAGELEKL